MKDSTKIQNEIPKSEQKPKFKIMVDTVPLKNKPENAGVIVNRLKTADCIKEVNIQQLFNYILSGYTVRPGVLIDGGSEVNFKQQNFVFVDVDNDKDKGKIITLDEVISIFEKHNLHPVGYYYTFSSTKEYPRFRVIFRLEEPITDITKMKLVLNPINKMIPNADLSCTTVAKIFYGTNNGGEILNENAVITLDQIENLIKSEIMSKNDTKYSTNKELNKMIKDFNFFERLCKMSKITYKGSNYYTFDTCPICRHHKSFTFYPDDNSFCCFSASCHTGGSIINFLMALKKMSKKEAIDYFKYELMKLPREQKKNNIEINKLKVQNKKIIEEQIKELHLDITLPDDIDWLVYKDENDVPTISCPRLAKYIQENLYYIFINTDVDDKVPKYFYANGYYNMFSDKKVKKIIKSLIPLDLANTKSISEVFEFICMDSKYVDIDKLNSDEDIVNFPNGLFRLSTGKLEPHNPKYLSTIQFNCNYVENPPIPKHRYFDTYLEDLTSGDKGQQQLIWEYIGICLSNVDASKFKSSLILCGFGNTGKSQLPILLENLIGKNNYTSAELKNMNKNFTKINLLNKRLAVFSDVSTLKLESLDTFKRITGGDTLNDAWKFKDSLNFKFKGVMIMTMNEFLKFGGDDGDHVWERFIPIETTNIIPPEKRDKNLVKHMLEEKEYIISKALKMAKKVIENGYNYTIPDSVLKTRTKYRNDHESVKKFIIECTERVIREPELNDPTTGQFYCIYQNWVKANNLYDEGHSKFRETILKETGEQGVKKTHGGNTFYRGIIPIDEVKVTFGEEKGVFK